MEDVEAAAKLNEILYTSTSASQLNRNEFTKDDIVQLLDATNQKLPGSERIRLPAYSKKKLIH
eukprot:scaffold400274_cov24-Attheya_sp.AAC.1